MDSLPPGKTRGQKRRHRINCAAPLCAGGEETFEWTGTRWIQETYNGHYCTRQWIQNIGWQIHAAVKDGTCRVRKMSLVCECQFIDIVKLCLLTYDEAGKVLVITNEHEGGDIEVEFEWVEIASLMVAEEV